MSKKYPPISVLGSTGSIGTQTLEVARHLNIKITALTPIKILTCSKNRYENFLLIWAACVDHEKACELKKEVADTATKIYSGEEGLIKVATETEAETVVTAISGMVGLLPTAEAIKAEKKYSSREQRNHGCRGRK